MIYHPSAHQPIRTSVFDPSALSPSAPRSLICQPSVHQPSVCDPSVRQPLGLRPVIRQFISPSVRDPSVLSPSAPRPVSRQSVSRRSVSIPRRAVIGRLAAAADSTRPPRATARHSAATRAADGVALSPCPCLSVCLSVCRPVRAPLATPGDGHSRPPPAGQEGAGSPPDGGGVVLDCECEAQC